jgi:hypothetical protein
MRCIFICGYRGSGKDTLCYKLIHGEGYDWLVYGENDTFDIKDNYIRFGFADILKKQVEEEYNIPHDIQDKESKQFNSLSARDVWINFVKNKLEGDINYFCKYLPNDNNYIVTDWRYLHELEYSLPKFKNINTIRVFRNCVEIPDNNIESEHNLDSCKTNFLLVDKEESFIDAIRLFPQYNQYKHIVTI